MTPQEIRAKYKTTYNFRKQTGMSTSSLKNWETKGFIPVESQMRLEAITNGEFKASIDHLPYGQNEDE